MFVCLDCDKLFEEPKHYIETHGLESPPYEEFEGCPYCGGTCVETYRCDCCGQWLVGSYVKTKEGFRYCDNCYTGHELGEE